MAHPETKQVERPVLVFDGDCGFCRRAVLRFEAVAGDRVAYVPFQEYEFPSGDPRLTAAGCAEAVHLVEVDGTVTRAAEACFRAFGCVPGKRWIRHLYGLPLVAPLTEWLYRWIAAHRVGVSRVNRGLSGNDPEPPSFLFGRRLFVTALGLAFLAAFWSFGVQAAGLIGSEGILPLERMVAWDAHVMPNALLEMPSLFWFAQGDAFLWAVVWGGAVAGGALAVGLWPRLSLLVALACWLSLTSLAFPPAGPDYIGNVFLGFQWDGLLVEAGVLGVFVAPRGLRARWSERPSAAGVLLLRVLLLRVVVGEVLVRHVSGDPTWSEPGALGLHLWTQKMPTWIGVLAHEWGAGLLDALLLVGDVIGLVLVWGLLLPRRLRLLAVFAIVLSQLGGLGVGRLGVWPLLVIGLGLLAVDDQTWRRLLPGRVSARVPAPTRRDVAPWVQGLRGLAACALLLLAAHVSVRYFTFAEPSPLQRALLPYQVCNGYGPSPSVILRRFALSIELTGDGETWSVLEPRSFPRDAYRAPPGPGLHLRRLDWQLADAAQALAYGDTPPAWFVRLLVRLLEGAPDARALFADGAFDDAVPRALRVQVHELTPASELDRERDGMWWYRRPGALVVTPVTVEDGELVPLRF